MFHRKAEVDKKMEKINTLICRDFFSRMIFLKILLLSKKIKNLKNSKEKFFEILAKFEINIIS